MGEYQASCRLFAECRGFPALCERHLFCLRVVIKLGQYGAGEPSDDREPACACGTACYWMRVVDFHVENSSRQRVLPVKSGYQETARLGDIDAPQNVGVDSDAYVLGAGL